jgi:hypothetical protein
MEMWYKRGVECLVFDMRMKYDDQKLWHEHMDRLVEYDTLQVCIAYLNIDLLRAESKLRTRK